MKQPLWILNSILLVVLFIVLLFVVHSTTKVPPRASIVPKEETASNKKEVTSAINVDVIYKNDLFNTFQAPRPVKTQKTPSVRPMPQPPRPLQTTIPKAPTPQFLEPLPLTLTGVITFNNKNKSRALIVDNKTRQETMYKLEDEIEDAQLIGIFKNKVILLRSNGQQEAIFLKDDGSHIDNPSLKKNWDLIVKPLQQHHYLVNMDEFSHSVKTLGDFIYTFNLATAINQGKTIGLRVGALDNNSLPHAMGIVSGDVITAVNGIPATTQENRLAMYNKVISLSNNDMVTVSLLRNNKSLALTYALSTKNLHAPVTLADIEKREAELQEKGSDTMMNIEEEAKKFAPTLKDIKLRDKQHIFQYKQTKTQPITEVLE